MPVVALVAFVERGGIVWAASLDGGEKQGETDVCMFPPVSKVLMVCMSVFLV